MHCWQEERELEMPQCCLGFVAFPNGIQETFQGDQSCFTGAIQIHRHKHWIIHYTNLIAVDCYSCMCDLGHTLIKGSRSYFHPAAMSKTHLKSPLVPAPLSVLSDVTWRWCLEGNGFFLSSPLSLNTHRNAPIWSNKNTHLFVHPALPEPNLASVTIWKSLGAWE